jgi:hypothetical protein
MQLIEYEGGASTADNPIKRRKIGYLEKTPKNHTSQLLGPLFLEPKLVTFEEVRTDPCGWNSSVFLQSS